MPVVQMVYARFVLTPKKYLYPFCLHSALNAFNVLIIRLLWRVDNL